MLYKIRSIQKSKYRETEAGRGSLDLPNRERQLIVNLAVSAFGAARLSRTPWYSIFNI